MSRYPLWAVISGLLRLTRNQRWLVPLLIVLGLVAFLFEGLAIFLLMPLLQTFLVSGNGSAEGGALDGLTDALLGDMAPDERAGWLVAAIVFCFFLKGATALVSQTAFAFGTAQVGHDLRQQIFAKILGANQQFIDTQPAGALFNIQATESWRLSQGLQVFSQLVTHGCAVLVFLLLMIALSWKMTAVIAVAITLIFAIIHVVTSQARRFGDKAVVANQGLAERVVEGLGGLRTIRLFGQADSEKARFERASRKVKYAFFKMDVLSALPTPLFEVMFALLIGLLLLSVEPTALVSVVVMLALLQRMQPHATGLMNSRVRLLALGGSLDKTDALLNDPDARPLEDGRMEAVRPASSIRFDRVSFRYVTSAGSALNRTSFDIPVGQTTALVGASGSGKSTILALMCRLMDPSSGAVLVDGIDLKTFKIDSWRARIAVVPQEVHLFSATIRQNIAYGFPDADDEAIKAAARTAKAEEFIVALQDGYDTLVGDGGVRLSGGQRQRIALARAILRQPDLLILDEATNALDSLSERMVQDAIAEVAEGRTLLIVAHRMASIRHAHHVIVLDKGQVIEEGPPIELRKANGVFAQLLDADRFV
jgi:ATP-binding cassette, subfamily B, bacterial MsbA